MNVIQQNIFKIIIPIGLIIGLFYYVSQLNLEDATVPQYLENKNKVIFNKKFDVKLNEEEKLWLEKHPVIRVGIDRASPPFGSVNEEDYEYIGFSADFMKIIEHRLGVNFYIDKQSSWDETLQAAKDGELDMVSALVNTKERQAYLDFTEPYTKNPTIIINDGANKGYIGSIRKLGGRIVAIEKGSYLAGVLAKKNPNIELIETKNTSMALSLVSAGVADAYVGNAVTASYLIKVLSLQNLAFSGQTEYSSNHSIGIAKTNPILSSIMKKSLASISEDDRNVIKDYWFGQSVHPKINARTALYFFAAFVVLLILAILWILSLRKARNRLKESRQEIKLQAEKDHLTGLGNRRKFYQQLDSNIEWSNQSNYPFTLVFLDLDMFKEVNDSLGHFIGDQLLIEVSKRIRACIPAPDSIFRLGGDEFMLLLHPAKDRDAIEHIVGRVRDSLNKIYTIEGNEINITTSMGITSYPVDADSAEQLVINGDQAMYNAKKSGRNCYSYFTQKMQQEAHHKNETIKDLKTAVEENQFELHYQPIIDLDSYKIAKAEALIRWYHPTRGLIPPLEFIPLAEETGMINTIGEWVFKQAVSQTVDISNNIYKDFQMSINTSPVQFYKNGMDVVEWNKHLTSKGLSGENILIEITESILMKSKLSVKNNLFQLRDHNIQIAIDDFGTGYSSLSYLKKFEIDYLKIDQSFVRNLTKDSDDFILIQTIINMAHQLGCKVIAEGVETEEQKQLVQQAGCDFGQGYYFSKPIAADDFYQLIQNWNQEQQTPFIKSVKS